MLRSVLSWGMLSACYNFHDALVDLSALDCWTITNHTIISIDCVFLALTTF